MSVVLPVLKPIDPAERSPVAEYLAALTPVCPFIDPSAKARNLYACEVTPDCRNAAEIHPRLFEQLVPIIERFRDDRRALMEKQQRLLLCHMVVIHIPAPMDAEAARLLNWPNWLGWVLKQLYTPKEIVFGFVRKNVAEKSTTGRVIPASPFHAVVIRSRVVGSDHRFFSGNQSWLQAMMEAEDDGANVHEVVFGQTPDIRDPQAMRDAGYYQRVQQWGQTILPRK